ncbi:hypothetical protein AX17_000484 [Amanita inopinata Kibby_2008]|nr:hypothetical protein AX17_000484 [Amanita inopinata Kibby_2008]
MRQCSSEVLRIWRIACVRHLATRLRGRTYSVLAQKVEQLKQKPEPVPINVARARLDAFSLVSTELAQIRQRLLALLGSTHPGLTDTAAYYFIRPSVQLRSLLILLFSRATNGLGVDWQRKLWEANYEEFVGQSGAIDQALQDPDVLHDWHPTMPDNTASFRSTFELQVPTACKVPSFPSFQAVSPSLTSPPSLLPSQIRLAQIIEMIHVASLLHNGVHDGSACRVNTEPNGIENKVTILGGDFLLGRASAVLARLGDNEVVELVAGIISNIVEGEMLHMEDVKTPKLDLVQGPTSAAEAWSWYLKKTYLKTASLMAKGARASVVLGGCKENDTLKEIAYVYGRNLGFAKQLMDDASDYEYGLNGVRPGLATAPVLYALEEHSEIQPLVSRRLTQDGDVESAVDYVRRSSGIERTRGLARTYAEKAREVLLLLPASDTVDALETLVDDIVTGSF